MSITRRGVLGGMAAVPLAGRRIAAVAGRTIGGTSASFGSTNVAEIPDWGCDTGLSLADKIQKAGFIPEYLLRDWRGQAEHEYMSTDLMALRSVSDSAKLRMHTRQYIAERKRDIFDTWNWSKDHEAFHALFEGLPEKLAKLTGEF